MLWHMVVWRGRGRSRALIELLEQRRLLSAGQLDPTFGSGGMGAGALFPGGAATAMAVQPDGSILAAGTYFSPSDPSGVFGLARYRRGGSADRAFGVGGHV